MSSIIIHSAPFGRRGTCVPITAAPPHTTTPRTSPATRSPAQASSSPLPVHPTARSAQPAYHCSSSWSWHLPTVATWQPSKQHNRSCTNSNRRQNRAPTPWSWPAAGSRTVLPHASSLSTCLMFHGRGAEESTSCMCRWVTRSAAGNCITWRGVPEAAAARACMSSQTRARWRTRARWMEPRARSSRACTVRKALCTSGGQGWCAHPAGSAAVSLRPRYACSMAVTSIEAVASIGSAGRTSFCFSSAFTTFSRWQRAM
eukprot:scaffold7695_cov124-Isochrysis_galbana.AAC.2